MKSVEEMSVEEIVAEWREVLRVSGDHILIHRKQLEALVKYFDDLDKVRDFLRSQI